MTTAIIIQLLLKICLAAIGAYFIKETWEALVLSRQSTAVTYASIDDAIQDRALLSIKLEHFKKNALMGFCAGISTVYARLVEVGSHEFTSQTLIFPLIGIFIAGLWEPQLSKLLEPRLLLLEATLDKMIRNEVPVMQDVHNDPFNEQQHQQEVVYEIVDEQK